MLEFRDVIERPDYSLSFLMKFVSHINGTKEALSQKRRISPFFHLNHARICHPSRNQRYPELNDDDDDGTYSSKSPKPP